MSAIQRLHVFIDGNYLFFSARAIGATQDFAKLEEAILHKFGADKAQIVGKHFYTRPPEGTDSRAVVGWLRAHGWQTTTFNYPTTHQDSLYVNMVHDMWLAHSADIDQGLADECDYTTRIVVVSGSGALAYPLASFPHAVILACLDESTNKRLKAVESILTIPLNELL